MITLLLSLAISSPVNAGGFECTPQQEVKWNQISEGMHWTKYDLAYTPYLKDSHLWESTQSHRVTVRAFKIDFNKNKLLFHSRTKELSCDPTQERFIQKLIIDANSPIIGAINASFFVMPDGGILGMAKDENKLWAADLSNQTISSSGIFSIENGIPSLESRDQFIFKYGTAISTENASRFSFAVQAYPKLLINHDLQISDGVLNSRRPRTSIGFSENPNELILLTIDARGENSRTGMTLYEFAHLVKTEQCGVAQKTVLNLDGGGSTSFAIPSLGLYEQADHCRNLGNILTIQKR